MCEDCIYATYDYFEYYGGAKQYFIDGCKKECDIENSDDCEEYKMVDMFN